MIAALLLSTLCLPATDGPTLTPELLVDHPGLREGAFEAVREDWLSALEADPGSPWAYTAAVLIREASELCHDNLEPARLIALAERIEDGAASHVVRNALRDELQVRACSAELPSLPGDLFADFLGSWHLLGPYGPLTGAAPLYRQDPDAPEGRLSASYPSAFGTTLSWREFPRPRNQSFVLPRKVIYPDAGGVCYLLTFVKAPAEEVFLEVFATGAFQAYWNGSLVLECHRNGATEQAHRFVAPVRSGSGWNAVLIRFLNESKPVAARLLDKRGRWLEVEEADWNGRDLPVWSETAPATLVLPDRATGAPFEEVLEMLMATVERRADQALAVAEPADSAELPAWLRARHDALANNLHLPDEVERRLQLEVEKRLDEIGVTYPEIELHRADRLIAEDKPEEALEVAEALVTAHPDTVAFWWLRARALLALDPTGSLARPCLAELLARFGDHAPTLTRLGQLAAEADDWVGAADAYQRALRAGGFGTSGIENLFAWLALDHGTLSTEAEGWLEAWAREFPGDRYAELLQPLLRERGDLVALRALLEEDIQAHPGHVGPLLELANSAALDGREGEVVALLREVVALKPGHHGAHESLALLGVPDEAEEFFREFAPDARAARAAPVSETDASTALVLDSGLVYIRPDGATRQRTHAIQLALDRTGTERLHEEPAQRNTLVARVLDVDGTVFEPVLVDGTWVWPSLDPGDAVEQVYDRFTRSLPGAAAQLGAWSFASFEQPFVYSRYAVFVPDGLPGEWRQAHFKGTHQEIPWRGGTVHVFLQEAQARYKEEPFRPSNSELVPWVNYGDDLALDEVVVAYRSYVRSLSLLAADLRFELEPIVAATEGRDRERAEALFKVVTDRVLEFSGDGDTTVVWTMRRGSPIGLLAALFDLAEIEYDWAVLAPPIAPELDPAPEPAFLQYDRFGLPCLRLAVEAEGEPLWVVVPPAGRNLAFGSIPEELAGARALILDEERAGFVELPRDSLADAWSLDLDVVYRLDPKGTTAASGTVSITGSNGAYVREQIFRIEPEQRSQVARNLTSQAVQGLNLADWEFVDLDQRGGSLQLKFSGTLPGFLQGTDPARTCRLRLPPNDLSTSFGAAEREWPLVFRRNSRTRVRVRIECGESWNYEFESPSCVETSEGFRYEFQVTREEGALEVLRIVELRGMVLEPSVVPAFLTRCKEFKDAEEREVRLMPR